jgi:hypothetical protein
MVIFVGALCFGLVLGWLTAYLAHHSRAGWRELKVALAVLLGAAMQSMFGGWTGLALYAIGLVVGAALYGVTLIVRSLRHTHDFYLPTRR